MSSIYPKYEGLPLIPSKAAMNELYKFGLTLQDVQEVLEEGYQTKRRKEGTLEKCIKRNNVILKVVVSKSYNFSFKTECWVVVHIGIVKW